VNFSRPSIDLLFETASEAYMDKLVGIILTGSNSDGAAGIRAIKGRGGLTIAQDPGNALFPDMPQAAIDTGSVQSVLTSEGIKNFLLDIGKKPF
jgi:two-component system chemotaxis response regulator CheB